MLLVDSAVYDCLEFRPWRENDFHGTWHQIEVAISRSKKEHEISLQLDNGNHFYELASNRGFRFLRSVFRSGHLLPRARWDMALRSGNKPNARNARLCTFASTGSRVGVRICHRCYPLRFQDTNPVYEPRIESAVRTCIKIEMPLPM